MKYWIHFSIFCIGTAWLVLGFVAFSLFWPVRTLEIQGYDDSHPVVVTETVIARGQPVKYVLNFCKYTNIPATVHRTLIDGQIITLAPTVGLLPTGCHSANVQTAVIPTTINPGEYYLDVVVSYQINPFRVEYIHYKTTNFTVIK